MSLEVWYQQTALIFCFIVILMCGVTFAVGGSQNLFETGNFRESKGRKWEERVCKRSKTSASCLCLHDFLLCSTVWLTFTFCCARNAVCPVLEQHCSFALLHTAELHHELMGFWLILHFTWLIVWIFGVNAFVQSRLLLQEESCGRSWNKFSNLGEGYRKRGSHVEGSWTLTLKVTFFQSVLEFVWGAGVLWVHAKCFPHMGISALRLLPFSFSTGRKEWLLAEVENEVNSSYGLTKYKLLSNVK